MTWFDDDEYIGTEVSFPSGSVWRIDMKIREHGYYETQMDCEELDIQSEARGVFICSKVSGHGPSTAIVKIRLQSVFPNTYGIHERYMLTLIARIPWFKTASKRPDVRAKQAVREMPSSFNREIEALCHLTKKQCSSTPKLFSWKADEQTDKEWVPGGYKLSILMEKLPGSDPSDLFLTGQMPIHERNSLRKAFKEAWL